MSAAECFAMQFCAQFRECYKRVSRVGATFDNRRRPVRLRRACFPVMSLGLGSRSSFGNRLRHRRHGASCIARRASSRGSRCGVRVVCIRRSPDERALSCSAIRDRALRAGRLTTRSTRTPTGGASRLGGRRLPWFVRPHLQPASPGALGILHRLRERRSSDCVARVEARWSHRLRRRAAASADSSRCSRTGHLRPAGAAHCSSDASTHGTGLRRVTASRGTQLAYLTEPYATSRALARREPWASALLASVTVVAISATSALSEALAANMRSA